MNKVIFFIIFLCVCLDQISKFLIANFIDLNSSIIIIKNFLSFTYIHNTGVAFGMLNNLTYFIILLSIIILILLTKEMKKYFYSKLIVVSYSICCGGLIGNLIDRVVFGYVRDFINVTIINFPIFNISDIFIVCGIAILLFGCLKLEEKNEKNCSN